MELTDQQQNELFMLTCAAMEAHQSIESESRKEFEWEYEAMMFKTLANYLRKTVHYVDCADDFDNYLKLPRDDKPFMMDKLESIGVEVDTIYRDSHPTHTDKPK